MPCVYGAHVLLPHVAFHTTVFNSFNFTRLFHGCPRIDTPGFQPFVFINSCSDVLVNVVFVRNSFLRTESILRRTASRSGVSLNRGCPCTPLARKEHAPPRASGHGFARRPVGSSVSPPAVRPSGKLQSCPSTRPGPRVGWLLSV